MEKEYTIKGMTCGKCAATVKETLEAIPGVKKANIHLESSNGILSSDRNISTNYLNKKLQKVGNYTLQDYHREDPEKSTIIPEKSIATYKPLILIVSFIAGISLLAQYPFLTFSLMLWMRYFMAGFFIVFSFFKLLNLSGFVNTYRMYDILAARWISWGYLYPFIELGLGVAYFIDFSPQLTNLFTVIVLGVSSIGVIRSNLNKSKIKCACLGDIFNLPMSEVTIIEDLLMVGMALLMLIL